MYVFWWKFDLVCVLFMDMDVVVVLYCVGFVGLLCVGCVGGFFGGG